MLNYLSAELENSETNGDDEWEEWQLECIECFDTQNTKTQWNKCDYFQKDESQNWNGNFLQLRFAWFDWSGVEFNFEVNFVILKITGWNGYFSIAHW